MQFVKWNLNRETMQQILDCFVELTGIRAAYFENHIELVNGKNQGLCSFCSSIRQYPGLGTGCIESDRAAVQKAEKTKIPYFYTCHMGLWETVIPVFVRNVPAGYLMLGQVKNEEASGEHWDRIGKKLSELNLTDAELNEIKSAFDDVLGMSIGKIKAAVNMLDIIASYIIDADVIRIYDLEAVEKAKRYIEEHYRERIPTGTVACIAGLSPSYLGYLFKRETGKSIIAYLEEKRLKPAKELLETTSLPVGEIARSCGYEDQNYFSRIFKKLEGVSPLVYRKNKRRHFFHIPL